MKLAALLLAFFLACTPAQAASCLERSAIQALFEDELKILHSLNEIETKAFLSRHASLIGEAPAGIHTVDSWVLRNVPGRAVLVISYDRNGCYLSEGIFPVSLYNQLINGAAA